MATYSIRFMRNCYRCQCDSKQK